ncbi:DNA internalization-related competence protein ComEC/Rec2 [Endozoicomonas montiporae]|uniref:Competence protein ComEC n=1 Tax=Endozoicomonas montiporae CL-33 TaxID=570277 RepID=A0A142BE57_9GAMM|nr:DNA internalization-related competence protein ComEC/Rec2 [Endozoicomonas montiporae]AMO57033.1 competence protein ComEC [Endozoicomonas montiporae CL-33]
MIHKTRLLCPENNKHSIHLGSCVFTYITALLLVTQSLGQSGYLCLKVIGFLLLPLIPFWFGCPRLRVPSAFYLLGLCVGYLHAIQVQNLWVDEDLFGRELTLKVRVQGLPANLETLQRFDVSVSPEQGLPLKKLRLSWYGGPEMQPGDQWQLTVKLKPPLGSSSPGAFDMQAWAAREGIQATGYVVSGLWLGQGFPTLSERRDQLRQSIGIMVRSALQSDSSGLLIALMTGDKSGISQAQWQWLNQSGTTHLMVISGLHIGLMAGLGFWLSLLFGRLGLLPLTVVPLPVIASIIALLMALSYATLAGFTVPVQRALVMTGIALSGPLLGIKAKPSTLYLLALAVVLTLDPLAITSAGFWYSFAAVGVLLYGFVGRVGMNRHWQRWGHPQWLVFLLLFPMLQFNGQSVSLLSPLINLVAIPLVAGLMVPLALFTLLVSLFSEALFYALLVLLEKLMSCFLLGLEWLDQPLFGHLSLEHQGAGVLGVMFASLAVFILLAPAALGIVRLVPVLLLPWLLPKQKTPTPGLAEVSVLDVGQGVSVFVRTHSHSLLYDTGDAIWPRFSMADRVVVPYLRKKNVNALDRVVISHGDRDHAGGLNDLEKSLVVRGLWAGSGVPDYSGYIKPCETGATWEWDQVRFEFIAGSGSWSMTNDRSCVLKVTANGQSLLLTGDIGWRVEKELLSRQAILKSDYLLLPHHGSRHSGSPSFLNAVQPEVTLISAGYRNRFGHPSAEVLDRLEEQGSEVFNTAVDGTLEFTLGQAVGVQRWRQQQTHYWQRPIL